jgi:hypothetical protein
LERLTNQLVPSTVGRLRGVEYAVGGGVAQTVDDVAHQSEKLPWVVGFVLLLTFVMMAFAFRSVNRHERSAEIVRRAVGRGEVPVGTGLIEVIQAACAPIFYRLFIAREPVTEPIARAAARSTAIAAKAGAYVVA